MSEGRPDVKLAVFAGGAFAHHADCAECALQGRDATPAVVTVRLPMRTKVGYSYLDLCRKCVIQMMKEVKEALGANMESGGKPAGTGGRGSEGGTAG